MLHSVTTSRMQFSSHDVDIELIRSPHCTYSYHYYASLHGNHKTDITTTQPVRSCERTPLKRDAVGGVGQELFKVVSLYE